jgi:hypothetical protein
VGSGIRSQFAAELDAADQKNETNDSPELGGNQ